MVFLGFFLIFSGPCSIRLLDNYLNHVGILLSLNVEAENVSVVLMHCICFYTTVNTYQITVYHIKQKHNNKTRTL